MKLGIGKQISEQLPFEDEFQEGKLSETWEEGLIAANLEHMSSVTKL